jgi:hypothetical protein
MTSNCRHPRDPVATPSVNNSGSVAAPTTGSNVVLYQDSDGTTAPPSMNLASPYTHVTVGMKLDQDVTLVHQWGPTVLTPNASLVIINGTAGAGETVAATAAYFQRSIRLQPGRNRISLVNGATAPTANHVAIELNSFAGIIQ